MNKSKIENKIKELELQAKNFEINFHRVNGAIALLQEQLAEINEPLIEDKEVK